MLDVAYRESPVCAEARSSLMSANVTLDKTNENPSVIAWRTFSGGPHPGHRAPDAFLNPHDEHSQSLFDLFRGTPHTLLLFDGAAATEEGYENLISIAEAVQKRFGELISTHLITPHSTRPEGCNYEGSLLLDGTSEMHDAYGAKTECIYLIRPDGYVGFRSQPATEKPLMDYLDQIFV